MRNTLPATIHLGVSACLTGDQVRYDGQHKLDSYVTGPLARHFTLVPICPEVAIGLGVPREPIRLEGDPAHPRAIGVHHRTLDVTDALTAFGRHTAAALPPISGYILKAKSPSCGMARVKVYGDDAVRSGVGLFARQLMAAHPPLPLEEEGGLADPERRDNFLARVFAYRRWQEFSTQAITAARLIQFHGDHKLLLMAHSPERYRALGRMVAGADRGAAPALADEYGRAFMAALTLRATARKHANVLHHLLGYLKRDLDAGAKAELVEVIERFRTGRLPLSVPLALLRRHFCSHPHPYVERQVYLHPSDAEAQLRFGAAPATAPRAAAV